MTLRRLLVAAAVAFAAPAGGQVLDGLGVALPPLPGGRDLPVGIGDVGAVARELTPRLTRITTLLRANPRLLETDGRGAPVVRGEVLATNPSDAALAAARSAGFTIIADAISPELGLRLVTLTTANRLSARRAVARLRAIDPEGSYEFNHIYTAAGAGEIAPAARPSDLRAASGARIGLVDAGVPTNHPMLRAARIITQGFAGAVVASDHGAATASLLVGPGGGASGATLLAADVYGGKPTGGNAAAIVGALSWLVRERASIINISLVGPPNAALKAAVDALASRGIILVAAVGNDGPAAPPLYPAAYPSVVAVTAVDARDRVLIEACRGAHIDFAAPGAGIRAAARSGDVAVRGTSFAAPIVAGALARHYHRADPQLAAQAIERLAAGARDLGRSGPDPVYGRGLVGTDQRRRLVSATQNFVQGRD